MNLLLAIVIVLAGALTCMKLMQSLIHGSRRYESDKHVEIAWYERGRTNMARGVQGALDYGRNRGLSHEQILGDVQLVIDPLIIPDEIDELITESVTRK